MTRALHIATIFTLLMASRMFAAEDRPFYWYGDTKIYLTPVANRIAAKLQPEAARSGKFANLGKYFDEIAMSPLRSEPILLSAAGQRSAAEAALAPAKKTNEAYELPTFQLNGGQVIVQNELIVRFKNNVSASSAIALIERFTRTYKQQPGPGLRYVIRVPEARRTLAWADIIHRNHLVEYAEPNFTSIVPAHSLRRLEFVHASPTAPASGGFPSDALFSQQWALRNVRAPHAWSVTHGAPDVKIAILDDGIDAAHPEFAGRIAATWNAITNSDDVTPSSGDTHGTAVAGIAGALTNNGFGIAALAPETRLIVIRMSTETDGAFSITNATISQALDRAVALGAGVINCSWVMLTPSKDVEREIEAAATKGRAGRGTVVVFAAGNGGGAVEYPANLSRTLPIIAAGAVNESDQLKTKSSSDGEDWWGSGAGPELTVIAPGVHVVTTVTRAVTPAGTPPFIKNFNGTSCAAPHVAAAAALLLSQHPNWTARQVIDRIASTADRLPNLPRTTATAGRLNVCRALGGSDCAQIAEP